jgi:2,3-bisphosphoglycerate-dependent phosphoglycerate mutase
MDAEVVFVRHAHSPYVPDREEMRGLSERGRRDAERLADLLGDEEIDAVLSSPYARARETVEPLAWRLGTEVTVRDEFRERRLAGSHVDDFDAAVSRLWDDFSRSHPGGESHAEAQRRGVTATEAVRDEYAGGTVVVGTHGTLLALILNAYDDRFDEDFWRGLSMPDAYRVTFDGREAVEIRREWSDE